MSKNEEIAVAQENTPKMRKWSFESDPLGTKIRRLHVHIHAHEVSWF